ncbi:hypothetical protein DIJ64_06355 [Mycobacterium leprae]|uniref:Uncharacterized protein n=1 Tax=Mycobacterium leprae TaxID=1769 RepID=A0AAD0KV32_MYCLR|nr:hypothetical protein DIJ64_06355 [Mycobacterium leprae]OAR19679.1 hypothetical protein A8144_04475 [Mycobacterium leprae 3125609]OAX71813.1 hypothetical protein A3216_03195 [Mycobacterium leprae 7935681]
MIRGVCTAVTMSLDATGEVRLAPNGRGSWSLSRTERAATRAKNGFLSKIVGLMCMCGEF